MLSIWARMFGRPIQFLLYTKTRGLGALTRMLFFKFSVIIIGFCVKFSVIIIGFCVKSEIQ